MDVLISAPGYRDVSLPMFLGPGKNLVVFRNETGLIPSGFAVDFTYWNTVSGGMTKAMAEISLYNGTDMPVFVTECDIVILGEASVFRLLGSEEAFVDFGVIPCRRYRKPSRNGLEGRFRPGGSCQSVAMPGISKDGEIHVAARVNARSVDPRDRRDVTTLVDEMDYDGDWILMCPDWPGVHDISPV